jgi:hypothetical protein
VPEAPARSSRPVTRSIYPARNESPKARSQRPRQARLRRTDFLGPTRRFRAWPPRLRAEADRERAWPGAMGWDRRLPQRRLALPAPARTQQARKRLALIAGYAAPYQPPREPEPERHVEAERPGELVGIDCFFVDRLSGTADRDRRRLLLRLGRADHLSQRQSDRAADLKARPPRRRRATGRRLAPGADAQRQRRRVPLP